MSVFVSAQVWKRYGNGGGEMLLALAIADHAHDDGTKIFPSIAHLAAKTRQSERTIQYQLRSMEASGWLILVNSGNGGRNQCREYIISPEWLNGDEIIAPSLAGAKIAPLEKGATDDAKGANDDVKGATGGRKGCKPLHPHITVMKHQEPSGNHHDEAFAQFWAMYPKKSAKAEALKAFKKIKIDDALVAVILRSLTAFKRCRDWTKDGGQYIPNAATWLNGKRWEDEHIPPPERATGSGKEGKFDSTTYVNDPQGLPDDNPIETRGPDDDDDDLTIDVEVRRVD